MKTEPEAGDIVSRDHKTWYAYEGRKPILVVLDSGDPFPENELTAEEKLFFHFPDGSWERWQVLIRRYMEKTKFWPDVWYQGERGEWNLLDLATGQYAEEEEDIDQELEEDDDKVDDEEDELTLAEKECYAAWKAAGFWFMRLLRYVKGTLTIVHKDEDVFSPCTIEFLGDRFKGPEEDTVHWLNKLPECLYNMRYVSHTELSVRWDESVENLLWIGKDWSSIADPCKFFGLEPAKEQS